LTEYGADIDTVYISRRLRLLRALNFSVDCTSEGLEAQKEKGLALVMIEMKFTGSRPRQQFLKDMQPQGRSRAFIKQGSVAAGLLASEEQKKELLPGMAALKLIGAWGLTEPSNGSDASALQSTARKVSYPALMYA